MTDGSGVENVLFVVLDTVRKDHLGPYGHDRPTTPALDRFADDPETVVFENAVAPAPWTLPVHASLFTGLYPSGHGADQENPYLEGATTLAQTLSRTGHDTACYSSNAWITPYTHLTDGFDDQDNFFQVMPGDLLSGPLAKAWQALNDDDRLRAVADKLVSLGNTAHEYLAGGEGSDSKTPAVMDRTREFVEGSDPGWFAFVNLMDAHLPYHPPDEYAAEFAPDVDSTAVCQNSKEYNSGARDIDDAEWEEIRALYDAEIAHMDAELGRLFDWLRETGRWEETMVVVCADHGELHGEHDTYGHEFCLYDPLVSVPLLVKHPDVAADPSGTVELLDLYHTVLDALGETGGAPASPGDEAVALDPRRSLLSPDHRAFPAELDPADPADPGVRGGGDYGFVEYARPVVELKQLEEKASAAGVTLDEDSRFYARMRAARRPDAKYVRVDRTPDEAFRLDSDPDELENLAGETGDHPALRETERALAAFESAVGGAWATADDAEVTDDAVDDFDEETQERLRDLGYLE